jgi:hypothetical protein
MADTTAPVIAINTVSTLTTGIGVVLFGVHTGLDYATLIAGVVGGATALSYLAPSKLIHRAFEVISAALLAGYSSPVLADVATHTLAKFDLMDKTVPAPIGLQLILAFSVGYIAHGVILPGLRKMGSAFVRRYSNE